MPYIHRLYMVLTNPKHVAPGPLRALLRTPRANNDFTYVHALAHILCVVRTALWMDCREITALWMDCREITALWMDCREIRPFTPVTVSVFIKRG